MPTSPAQNLDHTRQQLAHVGYIADTSIATSVFLASGLERPLLCEGPAGVGKTSLGYAIARSQGRRVIRLPCYEGLDESRALYEWDYGKQLLYTEILRERFSSMLDESRDLDEAIATLSREGGALFSEGFLLERPLLQALRSPEPCLLLIDEIDKADPEFEAFLLEFLSDFTLTIPELGTLSAIHHPLVLLTSNGSRELSDPLKRRCLHLWIPHPSRDREQEILTHHLPELPNTVAAALVAAVERLRTLDLQKVPSLSEVIDWARALLLLGHDVLSPTLAEMTLGVLLKEKDDQELAKARASDWLPREPSEETSAPGPG